MIKRTTAMLIFVLSMDVHAALITFDHTALAGHQSVSLDGDRDGVNDIMFSTVDPHGFNEVGPGMNQTYIDETGLEGSSLLDPDLRVDFLFGASTFVSLGFALASSVEDASFYATLRLFDRMGRELASATAPGAFTGPLNFFPEGKLRRSSWA